MLRFPGRVLSMLFVNIRDVQPCYQSLGPEGYHRSHGTEWHQTRRSNTKSSIQTIVPDGHGNMGRAVSRPSLVPAAQPGGCIFRVDFLGFGCFLLILDARMVAIKHCTDTSRRGAGKSATFHRSAIAHRYATLLIIGIDGGGATPIPVFGSLHAVAVPAVRDRVREMADWGAGRPDMALCWCW